MIKGKQKGGTPWETKAGKRIRIRVRNRRKTNSVKKKKRSRISNASNRRALPERNQDSNIRKSRFLIVEHQGDIEANPAGAYQATWGGLD
jgi:hypothetical protein